MAADILEEMRRRPPRKGKWAEVAERLAHFDPLHGRSEALAWHTREFRDKFRLRGTPDG